MVMSIKSRWRPSFFFVCESQKNHVLFDSISNSLNAVAESEFQFNSQHRMLRWFHECDLLQLPQQITNIECFVCVCVCVREEEVKNWAEMLIITLSETSKISVEFHHRGETLHAQFSVWCILKQNFSSRFRYVDEAYSNFWSLCPNQSGKNEGDREKISIFITWNGILHNHLNNVAVTCASPSTWNIPYFQYYSRN